MKGRIQFMNSMSRGYNDPCKKEKREEKCPTIIKCGCPSSTPVPALAALGTVQLTLASLTLDTSCLCDPKIKLDFTSNLVAGVAFIGNMSIAVFKQCRNQFNPVPVGPAWQVGTLAALSSQTFSFFVCDSDSCSDNDCCTYTVVATITSTPALAVGVSFNNSTLAATATCGANQCEKKCHEK
jgi:hypothetical protein